MERPRITLARLMVVVGLIAVEIAVARSLYLLNVELALGLALMGLASQFGLLRAIRDRGSARAFWSGFVVTSLAAMGAFAWGACFEDSGLFRLWDVYTGLADEVLAAIPHAPSFYDGGGNDLAIGVAAAVAWFLPQFLASIIGGVSVALVARMKARQSDDRCLAAASP